MLVGQQISNNKPASFFFCMGLLLVGMITMLTIDMIIGRGLVIVGLGLGVWKTLFSRRW